MRHHPLHLLAPALLFACGEQPAPAAPAAPVRYPMTEVGVVGAPATPHPVTTQLIEVKGGGLALLDVDGDADLDLFLPGRARLERPFEGEGARLFLNQGEMRFEEATQASGIDLPRWGFGCAAGDVDGDGRDDLFVACYGANALLRSLGDGTFEDVSEAAGLIGDAWSTAGAFGDLDGDGDLDLYVVNYVAFDPAAPPAPMRFRGVEVFGGPMGLAGAADQVFENLGDGRFRDVTSLWGFDAVPASYGLGAVVLDLDGDGDAEVVVGNDSQANFLFTRGAAGRFEDLGEGSGLGLDEYGWGQATMGIAVADVDGEGTPDIFTTNFMADHDTLHVNLGDLRFTDRSRTSGLALPTTPFLGWGCGFVDLDHDGAEELLVVHGHVYPKVVTEQRGWRQDQEPQLFEQQDGRWQLVPAEDSGPWLRAAHRDRGAAFGDLDGDGDVDVAVRELGGRVRLLRNDQEGGAWLIVRLDQPGAGNRRGLGARVAVTWKGETRTRWIASGTSYQSSSAPEAHFGLGTAPGPLTVEVRWPDGELQAVGPVSPNQVLEVTR